MYEDVKDWQRTTSLVTRRKRCRPGQFESYRLRAVERFALECGGAGLSLEWQERLYDLLDTWDGTKPGMPQDDGHNQTLREAFPTSNSFKNAIKDDVDDAVLEQGWCKCTMDVDGLSVTAFLCPALDVLLEALGDTTHVQYCSGPDGPAHPTVMRETPFDGDAFRLNEKHVVTQHGPDSFVLGVHLFSDASHISESGAHKLYPLRARLINDVAGEAVWLTLAYIPVISKQKEASADDRARQRRADLLQRVLYLVFRSTMLASYEGVEVVAGDRKLRAFPRILLYLADLPEEKGVLCLKSGACSRPCSKCDVHLHDASRKRALDAKDKNVIQMLSQHVEGAQHRLDQRDGPRRAYLEASSSLHSTVPALASMAGLGTQPFLLYKMIGFDILHVLDLGVTRTLVHRLLRVFPHICKNHDAVTAMFAEYAVLYGRIAGWITSTTPTPMTLSEAKDISQHAEDFVLNFVTPILGVVQTPKIHKLLRHVFDAINLHGNLQNGNTGGNEVVHKLDKHFYCRTNKTLADFTQQLVAFREVPTMRLANANLSLARGYSGESFVPE
eukprot:contig_27790_g6840